jgi:prolyl-tRNA synthetase
MTHGDDDGLVLPPRLAPKHVVIVPIYRNDDERMQVLGYCDSLLRELGEQRYDGGPVRVELDDRDLRGGEKVWQHVKRGVPVRLEVGPRDVASEGVFMGRRDRPARDKGPIPRAEFVATVGTLLEEVQQSLLDRALAFRAEHTRQIDDLDEFRAYFADETGGGFALCHWADDPAVDEVLAELRVTARCIPLDADPEEGRCLFTGKPSRRRVVFARAY